MPYDSCISRGDTPEYSPEPGAHPLILEQLKADPRIQALIRARVEQIVKARRRKGPARGSRKK